MRTLKDISLLIEQTSRDWSLAVAASERPEDVVEASHKLEKALLYVAVAVLSADEPLNVYERCFFRNCSGRTRTCRARRSKPRPVRIC
jgi:hypothetical protein